MVDDVDLPDHKAQRICGNALPEAYLRDISRREHGPSPLSRAPSFPKPRGDSTSEAMERMEVRLVPAISGLAKTGNPDSARGICLFNLASW